MIIGLDGQKLLIDKYAGPEVYTFNTFQALAKIDTKNKYVIYLKDKPEESFWQEITLKNSNFSYLVVDGTLSWTQFGLAVELFKNPPDVFFTTTHTIPVFHPGKTKVVAMIHGLEYKLNKEYTNTPIKRFIHPLILWWVLKFSKKIVVPSGATKNAITKKGWPFINLNKINVIPEGVSSIFYKRSEEVIKKIRVRYNLTDKPYLFFVSTIQPRKNIPNMIHAFSKFLEKNPKHFGTLLLIAGKLGWQYQDSLDAPKKYGVEKNVRFLGHIPESDLPVLLSGSEAFINCSLEEGFGIPLLEALACETKAIVSDINAFKELGGNLPVYVNPLSIDSICEGIEGLLKNKVTVNDISVEEYYKKAKKLANGYTWENVAEKLLGLFTQLTA